MPDTKKDNAASMAEIAGIAAGAAAKAAVKAIYEMLGDTQQVFDADEVDIEKIASDVAEQVTEAVTLPEDRVEEPSWLDGLVEEEPIEVTVPPQRLYESIEDLVDDDDEAVIEAAKVETEEPEVVEEAEELAEPEETESVAEEVGQDLEEAAEDASETEIPPENAEVFAEPIKDEKVVEEVLEAEKPAETVEEPVEEKPADSDTEIDPVTGNEVEVMEDPVLGKVKSFTDAFMPAMTEEEIEQAADAVARDDENYIEEVGMTYDAFIEQMIEVPASVNEAEERFFAAINSTAAEDAEAVIEKVTASMDAVMPSDPLTEAIDSDLAELVNDAVEDRIEEDVTEPEPVDEPEEIPEEGTADEPEETIDDIVAALRAKMEDHKIAFGEHGKARRE